MDILVESYSDVELALQKVENLASVTWHTLSPGLMVKLQAVNMNVESLEKDVSQQKLDRLGFVSVDFAKKAATIIDEYGIGDDTDASIGQSLSLNMQQFFFLLCYRAYLLSSFLKNNKGRSAILVGSPYLAKVRDLSLRTGEFENIFTALAAKIELPNMTRILVAPPVKGEKQLKRMNELGRNQYERLLRLINLDFSTLCFKAWEKLFHLRSEAQLWGVQGKLELVIIKQCELLHESFWTLLKKGARISHLFPPSCPVPLEIENEETISKLVGNEIRKHSRIMFPDSDHLEQIVQGVEGIFIERLTAALKFGRGYLKSLQSAFPYPPDVESAGTVRKIILTNALTAPRERLLAQRLKKQGHAIVSIDHGLGPGFAKLSQPRRDFDAALEGEAIAVFSDNTRDFFASDGRIAKRRIRNTGSYKSLTHIRVPRIQRRLARSYLQLKQTERALGFVCQAFTNNMLISPYRCNDITFYNYMKRIIWEILPSLPYKSIVKLYPAERFIDNDPFCQQKFSNVKPIQFVEFRYIRTAFDVLIASSPFSALSWVLSVNVPVIFLDFPENPLDEHVVIPLEQALFRIDCSDEQWENQLKTLLMMSKAELDKKWEKKRHIRENFNRDFIFGPTGDPETKIVEFLFDLAEENGN